MQQAERQADAFYVVTEPAQFVPSQAQLDALARRLIPEIKKLFADEQIQREYTEWLERRKADR